MAKNFLISSLKLMVFICFIAVWLFQNEYKHWFQEMAGFAFVAVFGVTVYAYLIREGQISKQGKALVEKIGYRSSFVFLIASLNINSLLGV